MALNNRKIFIIDPKFQFRFSFIICSLIFLGSLIYPITIYDLFDYVIALNPNATSIFEEKRSALLIYLIGTQIGFGGLVFVLCIFVSHKIVGPLFKMRVHLKKIRNNNENGHLSFRKGDQFMDLADELNQTIDHLRQKSNKEIEYLDEVSTYIENIALVVPADKKPVLKEIQKKLELMKTHSLE